MKTELAKKLSDFVNIKPAVKFNLKLEATYNIPDQGGQGYF